MCGIFSFVAESPEKFNPYKFKILGLKNDVRGGDAVGLYYNNNLHKSVTPPLFEKYIVEHKISKLETPLILGHVRKGSYGMGKTVEQAQPITILDDNDNIDFVLVHNGTLYNHKELATKYNVINNDFTDTQILTEIIYKNGYSNVLKEYEGAAALIWYDNRDKNVYVFKGASKVNMHTATISEERPLYWLKEDGCIYFSSVEDALQIIAEDNNNVEDIPVNILYKIDLAGNILEEIPIDRTKSLSYKTYTNNSYNNSNNTSNTYTRPKKLRDIADAINLGHVLITNKIIFRLGNYYIGEKLAHGTYILDQYGFIESDNFELDYNSKKYKLSFFNGILIYTDSFDDLVDELKTSLNITDITDTPYQKLSDLYKTIGYYAPYPYALPEFSNMVTKFSGDLRPPVKRNVPSEYFYSGVFRPLFINKGYNIHVGDYTSEIIYNTITSITDDIYTELTSYTKYNKTETKTLALPFPQPDNSSATITCPDCNGEGLLTNGHYCNRCYGEGFIIKSKEENTNDDYNDEVVDLDCIDFTDNNLEAKLELLDLYDKLSSVKIDLEDVGYEIDDFSHILTDSKNNTLVSIKKVRESILQIINEIDNVILC